MSEEAFKDLEVAFQASEDVREKSKREVLAHHLAAKHAAKLARRREHRCFLTFPFGHYYDAVQLAGDTYKRQRCLYCNRAQHDNNRIGTLSRQDWAFIVMALSFLIVFIWYIWL